MRANNYSCLVTKRRQRLAITLFGGNSYRETFVTNSIYILTSHATRFVMYYKEFTALVIRSLSTLSRHGCTSFCFLLWVAHMVAWALVEVKARDKCISSTRLWCYSKRRQSRKMNYKSKITCLIVVGIWPLQTCTSSSQIYQFSSHTHEEKCEL